MGPSLGDPQEGAHEHQHQQDRQDRHEGTAGARIHLPAYRWSRPGPSARLRPWVMVRLHAIGIDDVSGSSARRGHRPRAGRLPRPGPDADRRVAGQARSAPPAGRPHRAPGASRQPATWRPLLGDLPDRLVLGGRLSGSGWTTAGGATSRSRWPRPSSTTWIFAPSAGRRPVRPAQALQRPGGPAGGDAGAGHRVCPVRTRVGHGGRLASGVGGLPGPVAGVAGEVVAWLDRFEAWAHEARDAGCVPPLYPAAWQATPGH